MTAAESPTDFPGSPLVFKGGLVVYADPSTNQPTNIIVFQYNSETLTRGLQPQAEPNPRQNAGDTQHALPPLESYSLAIELDAADQLEVKDSTVVASGLHPALAALELLMYPASQVLVDQQKKYVQGASLIQPGRIPLVIFVWGANRVVPVRISSMSITEQAFDQNLNPIRAKVDLRLTTLTNQELERAGGSFGSLALTHLQQKEQIATKNMTSAAAQNLRSKVPF
jgi:Contractile injection system tube protein